MSSVPDSTRDRILSYTPCAGVVTQATLKGTSSIGRAAVSKTAGWGFKSLVPCETRVRGVSLVRSRGEVLVHGTNRQAGPEGIA